MVEIAGDAKARRKQLRRERISGRHTDGTSNEDLSSSKVRANCFSNKQVPASFERLDEIQAKSTDLVTEARVRTDQRESKRRDEEEDDNRKRDELLKQLQDSRHDDDVASGWENCLATTNVQDLCEMLDTQKNTCEAALTKLEHISKTIGSELREMDHEYVIALKRNRQEVELLQKCITDEHQMLKEAFEKELKLIEASLTADRNYILNTNKDELEALISKRKNAETESLERQRKVIDEHRNGIKESESKAEQDRENLKKKLESEVRRLEIELEDTRARHQFDTDKLEYNVRVLTELSENEEAVKKQKRRIMKGKEELNRELDDKHQAKAKGIRQNELLEGDCERIEKQSSGLKEKFERFKISDGDKYRAVLSMHRDDLQKLQGELKQSQDFIFGGAIGCCETAEQSYTSDVTWADASKSDKTNECKLDTDEFGLEVETSDDFNGR
mmetsp:Transcript_20638/g.43060  ORF Transcript_20638/g.43060 Transcript_20638/m.43060 type:complete len:446 (+) Transcript_20638:60-1397(+)